MGKKYFLFALCVLCCAGCATGGNAHVLELQRCCGRISSLEAQVKEQEREIAGLEYDMQARESDGATRSNPVKKAAEAREYPVDPSMSQIQKALKSAGYYKGSIDGKSGPKTQDAVMRFQKDNGLRPDGKVGRLTWAELREYLD